MAQQAAAIDGHAVREENLTAALHAARAAHEAAFEKSNQEVEELVIMVRERDQAVRAFQEELDGYVNAACFDCFQLKGGFWCCLFDLVIYTERNCGLFGDI